MPFTLPKLAGVMGVKSLRPAAGLLWIGSQVNTTSRTVKIDQVRHSPSGKSGIANRGGGSPGSHIMQRPNKPLLRRAQIACDTRCIGRKESVPKSSVLIQRLEFAA